MSFGSFLAVALLALCVLVDVLAVAGLIAMRTPMQRLHFVAPATCVAPVLAGLAVAVGTHATAGQAGKGLLIAFVLAAFSGLLSSESAKAIAARERAEH